MLGTYRGYNSLYIWNLLKRPDFELSADNMMSLPCFAFVSWTSKDKELPETPTSEGGHQSLSKLPTRVRLQANLRLFFYIPDH